MRTAPRKRDRLRAHTKQPASSTLLPRGYSVSECSNSTKVPAWSAAARFARVIAVAHKFRS